MEADPAHAPAATSALGRVEDAIASLAAATSGTGSEMGLSAAARFLGTAVLPLISTVANAQINLGAAPGGPPATVAARVIAKAGHPCPRVLSARRMPDGGIAATCSKRELYLVASIDRVGPVAMRCSAAKRLLGISCLK